MGLQHEVEFALLKIVGRFVEPNGQPLRKLPSPEVFKAEMWAVPPGHHLPPRGRREGGSGGRKVNSVSGLCVPPTSYRTAEWGDRTEKRSDAGVRLDGRQALVT